MADNTEMIKPDTGGGGNINELLPQGTIIPQTKSVGVGINISEIVITPDGDCINKSIHVMLFWESMRQTLVFH